MKILYKNRVLLLLTCENVSGPKNKIFLIAVSTTISSNLKSSLLQARGDFAGKRQTC
jgi:hypothetical protein